MKQDTVTAAVVLIGDEILSGRTQDTNLNTIANFLAPMGIRVCEGRVIADDRDTIVGTVQAMSSAYDYVFTTGGIGPTHDDITAECIAEAFNKPITIRDDARKILEHWYAARDVELTDARLRMARIPDDATLIDNPVSGAPGFILENVHVMAGVPRIMKAMLHNVGPMLKGGIVLSSVELGGEGLKEGDLAKALGELAETMPEVSFGSYPWYSETDHGVRLVARSENTKLLETAKIALEELIKSQGATPFEL